VTACRQPAEPIGALPGADAPGVVEGPALLEALRRGEVPPAGAVVVVLCGGEAGLECARALRRRGLSVTVICRHAPGAPPPCAEALAAAQREGIAVEPCAEPAEVICRGGKVRWLRLTRTGAAQRPDQFVLPADLVVLGGRRATVPLP
jgi:NADPH-dependent glutamate synthase beta subunit-like oxidoreductase